MVAKILTLLRGTTEYVSGQELCEKLGVSRTAIWKAIKKLQEDGYEIQAVNRKGYRLIETPNVLTAQEMESLMEDYFPKGSPYSFYYKEETTSTNRWAKQMAEEQVSEGAVFIVDRQTAGIGRRGRAWESPSGQDIYMSIVLRPDILPERASMLTLVMGLSVAQACKELLQVDARIKWPNDLVLSGKKACGILTEMSTQMECINYLVVGTGINVNTKSYPGELKDKATSLAVETGKELSRGKVLAAVLAKFWENYQIFLDKQDLSELVEPYNQLLANRRREVQVLEPGNEYSGVAQGINQKGELLVVKEDGTCQRVYAGEVSVRGLYGYV